MKKDLAARALQAVATGAGLAAEAVTEARNETDAAQALTAVLVGRPIPEQLLLLSATVIGLGQALRRAVLLLPHGSEAEITESLTRFTNRP